jgi:hypothetical protein
MLPAAITLTRYLSGSAPLYLTDNPRPALPAPAREEPRPRGRHRPTQWDDAVKAAALFGLFVLACASPIPGDEIAVAAVAAPVIFI